MKLSHLVVAVPPHCRPLYQDSLYQMSRTILLQETCTIPGKTAESPTNIFKTWLNYELQTEMGVWGLAGGPNSIHIDHLKAKKYLLFTPTTFPINVGDRPIISILMPISLLTLPNCFTECVLPVWTAVFLWHFIYFLHISSIQEQVVKSVQFDGLILYAFYVYITRQALTTPCI